MKSILIIFFCALIGCAGKTLRRHDELLQKLDKEELKEGIMNSDLLQMEDSLSKHRELIHDTSFMFRYTSADFELRSQKRTVADLKERILLEK